MARQLASYVYHAQRGKHLPVHVLKFKEVRVGLGTRTVIVVCCYTHNLRMIAIFASIGNYVGPHQYMVRNIQ